MTNAPISTPALTGLLKPGTTAAALMKPAVPVPAPHRWLEPDTTDLPLPQDLPPAQGIEARTQACLAVGVHPRELDVEQVAHVSLDQGAAFAFTLAYIQLAGLTGQPADMRVGQASCSRRWDLSSWWEWPGATHLLGSKVDLKGCGAAINVNQTNGGMRQFASYDLPDVEAECWPGIVPPSAGRVIITHERRHVAEPGWTAVAMSDLTERMVLNGTGQLDEHDRAAGRFGLLGDVLYRGDAHARRMLDSIPAPQLTEQARAVAVVLAARNAVRLDYARAALCRDVQATLRSSGLPHLTEAVVSSKDTGRGWDCRLAVRLPGDIRTYWAGTTNPSTGVSSLLGYVYGGPRLAQVQGHAPGLRWDAAYAGGTYEDGSTAAGAWRAAPVPAAPARSGRDLPGLREVTISALNELVIALTLTGP